MVEWYVIRGYSTLVTELKSNEEVIGKERVYNDVNDCTDNIGVY